MVVGNEILEIGVVHLRNYTVKEPPSILAATMTKIMVVRRHSYVRKSADMLA